MATKRVTISLEIKYEIIKCFESKVKTNEIVKRFGLKDRRNVHSIVKKKDKIKEKYENMKKKDAKISSYIRRSNYPQLEEAIIRWIHQMRGQKVPLSGPLIKEQALKFAQMMNINEFKASDGYIAGLKKRCNIEYRIESGESFSVSQTAIDNWKSELIELIKNYDSKDIFNLDETGLFWKLLPTKTYAFSTESRFGIKQLKNRVTLTVITNANGSERKVCLIGASKRPHCFRSKKRLPIDYYQQHNAWMDNKIFQLIVRKINDQMKLQKRKIILFVDNCSAHYLNDELSNVSLAFFPSNSTSVLQPNDLGIIKCLKTNYRKKLVSFLISQYETGELNAIKQMDLYTAMCLIKSSLKEIKTNSIINCYKKAGFNVNLTTEISYVDDVDFNEVWSNLGKHVNVQYESFESYIDVDCNVVISEILSDEDIIRLVQNDDSSSETEIEDEENGNEGKQDIKNISSSEAFAILSQLQVYFLNRNDEVAHDLLLNVQSQLSKTVLLNLKQSKITDFF